MSVYLLRNSETGMWAAEGDQEVDGFELASRRYNSEKAARKAARTLLAPNKGKPRAKGYMIVAFRLVRVGVVGEEMA